MCRSFRIVARLIFKRMKQLLTPALVYFWHKTTLELYKYLVLKGL